MNKRRDQCVSDLAKQMVSETPDEQIEKIAVKVIELIIVEVISDPRLGERFSAAIEHSKTGAENGASHPRAKRRAASSFSYDDVETPKASIAGPEANEMLDAIRERLTTADMLQRRRTLTEIAYDFEVPLAKRDTMPRMAQKILQSLAERDSDEIAKAHERISLEARRGTTEAFMTLAAGIMGDRRDDANAAPPHPGEAAPSRLP